MVERDDLPTNLSEVDALLARWRVELLSEVAHNQLLAMSDRATDTRIDLTQPEEVGPLLVLLDGGSVPLTDLHPGGPEAIRSLRAEWRQAQTDRLDLGTNTFHLGLGMVSWSAEDGPGVRGPVVVVPVEIVDHGRWRAADLRVAGPAAVNPALVALQLTDQDLQLAGADGVHTAASVCEAIDAAVQACIAHRQGSAVHLERRAVIRTFRLPRLATITEYGDPSPLHRENEVLRALAGEGKALDALMQVRVDRDGSESASTSQMRPKLRPVLHADSSQVRAIEAALDGHHTLIEGPPGTGKSQTISNLLVAAAAAGRRVLFVAEKRAAVDAVVDRLEAIDLAAGILDLHGHPPATHVVASGLLDRMRETGQRPSPVDAQDLLGPDLLEYEAIVREFHVDDEQLGSTPFELQTDVAATQLRATRLAELDALLPALGTAAGEATLDQRSAAEDAFIRIAGLEGWASSTTNVLVDELLRSRSLSTRSRANLAAEGIQALAQAMTLATSSVEELCSTIGVAEPETLRGWADLHAAANRFAERAAPFDLAVLQDAALVRLAQRPNKGRLTAAFVDPDVRAHLDRLTHFVIGEGGRASPLRALHDLVGARDELDPAWEGSDVAAPVGALGEALDRMRTASLQLAPVLDPSLFGRIGARAAVAAAQEVASDPGVLTRVAELTQAHIKLADLGLGDVVPRVLWLAGPDPQSVREAVRYLVAAARLRHGYRSRPGTYRFDRPTIEVRESQLASGYEAQLRTNRIAARQAIGVRARAAASLGSQLQTLQTIARERRSRVGSRRLFEGCGDVALAAAPCVVVSPSQVAELLGPTELFDLVVFDEASQIRPRDAIPAIVRGRTIVVVGDRNQLPPMQYFEAGSSDDELDRPPEPARLESILDAVASMLPPARTQVLTWHYRSEDPRLIAFPNGAPELYDGVLSVLPARVPEADVLRHLVAAPGEVVSAVVEEILLFARRRPEESMMVVMNSLRSAAAVDERLRQVLRQSPELDQFFRPERPEPFVIKNLERVQGDERDAVIVGLDWSASASGAMSYNFGPLGQAGGERRLNVAITRARRRQLVVTGFSTAEVDDARLGSVGARLLIDYLRWIGLGAPSLAEAEERSDPLLDVLQVPLAERGLWLDQRHPSGTTPLSAILRNNEGTALVAVDHNRRDLADLDAVDLAVLRPRLLHGRGWNDARVWSTEVLRDPVGVANRLAEIAARPAPTPVHRERPTNDRADGGPPDPDRPTDLWGADLEEPASDSREPGTRTFALDDTLRVGDLIVAPVPSEPADEGTWSRLEQGGLPLRWPDLIEVAIGDQVGPPDAVELLREGLRRTAAATGYRFRIARVEPDPDIRDADDLDLALDPWIWIGWAEDAQENRSGHCHSFSSTRAGSDHAEARAAVIRLRAGTSLPHTFGPGATEGNVLLHELGHALGLDHVDDERELMHPTVSPDAPDGFGPGDRRGLWMMGPAGRPA